MKPLKTCVNGCDRPPHPPSLVICRECIDKITMTLMEMANDECTPTCNTVDGASEDAREGEK